MYMIDFPISVTINGHPSTRRNRTGIIEIYPFRLKIRIPRGFIVIGPDGRESRRVVGIGDVA